MIGIDDPGRRSVVRWRRAANAGSRSTNGCVSKGAEVCDAWVRPVASKWVRGHEAAGGWAAASLEAVTRRGVTVGGAGADAARATSFGVAGSMG